MTEVKMPRLSESMEDGTILTWLKHDGDQVKAGEDLLELETDKATVTYASEADGALEILAAEGTTHPVGAVIARLGAGVRQRDQPAGNGTVVADVPPPPTSDQERLATPLARRAARAHGIDLADVSGSGPRGRMRQSDVLAAAGIERPPATVHAQASAACAAPPGAPAPGPDHELQRPTALQRRIARRMAQAKSTIPDFEVQVQATMDEALAIRERLKEAAGQDPVPSLNDLVIRACALALRRHSRVNAAFLDGDFKLFRRVNVGFAVAAEDALIVPTVFDADAKTLGAIAAETRRLADRVRSGSVTPLELSGATFTISNLGMFGMSAIRPIINPPQAAILGVGAVQRTLARSGGGGGGGGEIVERATTTLTLVADHRILYGADAARFLSDVRDLLESPLKLVL